ncbi:hypothetical protein J7J41_00245 [bacterium]|nr:hypothetical protein [bacterium]
MDEKNFNEKNFQGEQEENESKKITYHTLESDKKKLKESGGQLEFESRGEEAEIKDGIEDLKKNEEKEPPVFEIPKEAPKMEIVSPPNASDESEKEEFSQKEPEKKSTSSKSKIILIVVGVLIVVALVVGYFLIYPKIIKKEPASSLPVNKPPATEKPEEKPVKYVSLFKSQLPLKSEIKLSSLSLILLKSLLDKEASQPEEVGSLKEIIIYYQNKPLNFYDFFRTILPEVVKTEENLGFSLEDLFEKKLTVVLFYSETSNQLSYLGLIKEKKESQVESFIRALTQNPDLEFSLVSSHFFANPGNSIFNKFKEGKVDVCKTFYLPYENANLAINFGICKNYFLVASSKENIEKIIPLLNLSSQRTQE